MIESAAALLKSRLRADLTAALKAREKLQAALLRDLIAAIDNAEAELRAEAELARHYL